jgi:hypothetical protein
MYSSVDRSQSRRLGADGKIGLGLRQLPHGVLAEVAATDIPLVSDFDQD